MLTHLIAAIVIIGVTAAGLWKLGSGRWLAVDWLAAWLVAANFVAFGYHGVDKRQAGIGGARIPELTLHAVSLLGGGLGAYLGMRVFRHKTIKGSFRLAFWAIVAVQVAALIWLIWPW